MINNSGTLQFVLWRIWSEKNLNRVSIYWTTVWYQTLDFFTGKMTIKSKLFMIMSCFHIVLAILATINASSRGKKLSRSRQKPPVTIHKLLTAF